MYLPAAVKTGRDEQLGRLARVVAASQLVAGQLLGYESVVGLILVKGTDDVVAVAPGVRPLAVGLVAIGLGVAGDVQPMLGPALAVIRGGQQTLHDALVSTRSVITEEGVCLVWRGGEADQVEGDATQQRRSVGRGRGPEPGCLQPGEHESVNGSADPGGIRGGRQGLWPGRLERPVGRPPGTGRAVNSQGDRGQCEQSYPRDKAAKVHME